MGKTMMTLKNVFDRVDTMSRDCTDRFIDVEEISFDNLESVNIGDETHSMKLVAQRSMAYSLQKVAGNILAMVK